ncbi:MAG: hypothetical protein ACE5NN_03245 [Candidatus Bathyarchaeia archaeon]
MFSATHYKCAYVEASAFLQGGGVGKKAMKLKLSKNIFKRSLTSPFLARMKLGLSENWEVIEGLDGDFYILNNENGDWKEINRQEAEALRLLDGEKSVKEVIRMVCQNFPEEGGSKNISKGMLRFFRDCLDRGVLRKASIRR